MLLKNNKFIGAAGVLALVSNLSVTVACSEKINEIKDGEELYTDKYDEEDIYFQNMQDTKYDDYYNKDFEEQEYTYLEKPENENTKENKYSVNPNFNINEYESEFSKESFKNTEGSSDENNSTKDLKENGYIYLDNPEAENTKKSEEKTEPIFDVGKYGSISSEEYFKKLKDLNEEKIKSEEEAKKNLDITKYASISSEDYKKIKNLKDTSTKSDPQNDFSLFAEAFCEVVVPVALCLTLIVTFARNV